MQILSSNLPFFYRYIPPYFVVKRFLQGKLLREIWISYYDKQHNEAFKGRMYLTDQNFIVYLYNYRGIKPGAFATGIVKQLTEADKLTVIPDTEFDLNRFYSATAYAEKNLSISVSHPISYVGINDEAVLICGIQPDNGYSWNIRMHIFTGADFQLQTRNLVEMAIKILQHQNTQTLEPLPGISATVSLLQSYFILFVFITFMIVMGVTVLGAILS
jgi:hypothetical protein